MAADEFAWTPQSGATGEATHRRIETQFGDGYSQAVADGINPKTEKWPLTFTGRGDYIRAIRDFLDQRAGVTSFTWTPPLGVQGKWRSEPYQLTPIGRDVYQLSVTLQQVYA